MTNNQASVSENTMPEKLRLEYLAEMQITSWELREPFKLPELACEGVTDSNPDVLNAQAEANDKVFELPKEKIIDSTSKDVKQVSSVEKIKEIVNVNNSAVNDKALKHEEPKSVSLKSELSKPEPLKPVFSKTEKKQYLNLVKWSSAKYMQMVPQQTGSNDNNSMIEKNILIICRHKIDQPANSFASKRGPSNFMQDYLKTLVEFGLQNNLRISIQLAHLATAGLGESSITIESYFEKQQPDCSLVLGDETVENLIDKSSDVKNIRCRLNKFSFNANAEAIASYHPFDLISNPRLKSLAYEDIQFLISHLSVTSK